jgi:Ca2+-binding RTX toxin-like protein
VAEPTALEQYALELTNRARANPAGEAARLGIGLNDGISGGSLTATAKQPLAFNPLLLDAARAHGAWMLATDIFDHTGAGGSTPQQRMAAAGYAFTGSWRSAENIAIRYGAGVAPGAIQVELMHDGLFRSPGHRVNTLNDEFREAGIAINAGDYLGQAAVTTTQNYARSGSFVFLLGVAFADADADAFYDPGEGIAGMTVTIRDLWNNQVAQVATMAAGGWQVAVPIGTYSVTFSGGGLTNPILRTAVAGTNVKVDLERNAALAEAPPGTVGGPGNDLLVNHFEAALLKGLGGDDTLEGGGGADTLDGGDGYDVASYRGSAVAVSVSLRDDTAAGGDAEGDRFISIESLLGSAFDDHLTGDDGHNIIEGGAGRDTIRGLLGNDWISFENAAGAIAVNLDTGTGWAGDATGDLISGIENIRGSRFGDYLFGDWQANILRGDEGPDVLYGAANSDTIYYSTSPAAVRVDLSTNSASGGHAEGDTLVSVENVFATAFDDTLIGDSASNTLVGWIGRDILTGNGGNDIFRWSALHESGTTAATRDVVTDFWRVHGDLLDVSGIDARPDLAGDQAFAFIGYLPFNGAGQLRYTFDGLGNTIVELRTAASGPAAMQIQLTGTLFLEAPDFLL